MQEFKILGHIDLPERKIRPEEYRELLKGKMTEISHEVNEQFGCDFLDENGSILMAESDTLEEDKKTVSDLEENWAREQHKTVLEWRWARDKNTATITEMAITLVFHRMLKDRFIVARAATIDDYENGADNVLIDKETGAVVCGFDEVYDGEGNKDEKTKEALSDGGTSLKYGATIIDGQIVRKKLNSIPTFYISLTKTDLDKLLKDLKSSNEPTETEKNIVLQMITSLEKQYSEAKEIANGLKLLKNLDSFAESLEIIKNQINK